MDIPLLGSNIRVHVSFYTSRRAGRYRLRCYRHCCFLIESMHVKSESVVRGLSRKYKESERDAGHVGCIQLEQGDDHVLVLNVLNLSVLF